MTVLWAMIGAAAVGGGLWIMLRARAMPATSLDDALDNLTRTRPHNRSGEKYQRWQDRAVAEIMTLGRYLGVDRDQLNRDLAVVGRTPARHAFDKAGSALAVIAVAVAAETFMLIAGNGGLPLSILVLGTAGCAFAGFMAPDLVIRTEAARRRQEFRYGLSSYLRAVSMWVAGGIGPEAALDRAAAASPSWVFQTLNDTLATARRHRRSRWEALAEAADRYGVSELDELAGSVHLAAQGANLDRTLFEKAISLRDTLTAERQERDQETAEQMNGPIIVMFVVFVVFIGYPAYAVLQDL